VGDPKDLLTKKGRKRTLPSGGKDLHQSKTTNNKKGKFLARLPINENKTMKKRARAPKQRKKAKPNRGAVPEGKMLVGKPLLREEIMPKDAFAGEY